MDPAIDSLFKSKLPGVYLFGYFQPSSKNGIQNKIISRNGVSKYLGGNLRIISACQQWHLLYMCRLHCGWWFQEATISLWSSYHAEISREVTWAYPQWTKNLHVYFSYYNTSAIFWKSKFHLYLPVWSLAVVLWNNYQEIRDYILNTGANATEASEDHSCPSLDTRETLRARGLPGGNHGVLLRSVRSDVRETTMSIWSDIRCWGGLVEWCQWVKELMD